jgi:uncharacterized protein
MKSRLLLIACAITVMALVTSAVSVLAQPLSDEELSKRQVGQWLCDDPTGKSEFAFNADGTWSEKGVYFSKDGNYDVDLRGEWLIREGYYYQKLTENNTPEMVPSDDWVKVKIVLLDENENVVELPNGQLHRHQRKVDPAVAALKEDLIKEMVRAVDLQKMMDQMVSQLHAMLTAQLRSLNVREEDQEKFQQFNSRLLRKILDAVSWEKMEPEYVKLWSSIYTIDELKAILEFYRSTAGQSMMRKQPLLIQKALEVTQSKMKTLLPELKGMIEEFAASGEEKK